MASDFWSLWRRNETFHLELVQVPMFGPLERLPFPWFDKELGGDRTEESFLEEVEFCTK